MFFPVDGEPVLLQWEQSLDACRRYTWFDDIRGYGSSKPRPVAIAEAVKERKLRGKTIGIDLSEDAPTINPWEYGELKARLPEMKFVDATDLMQELRMVKTDNEIAFLRRANEIQCRAYSHFVKRIEKGCTESKVIGEMIRCQFESGAT